MMSKLQSVEAKHGTCSGDLPPLDTLRHEIGTMQMLMLAVLLMLLFMVTVLRRFPRLGRLDHQRPRVIDRPVPELVVQLLET